MKLYYFFSILFSFNFLICKICSSLFKKLEKNKILINYFPVYFSWRNQILENIFQFIFHYTTNYQKIINFPEIYFFRIHFPKKNYFPPNKRSLKRKA